MNSPARNEADCKVHVTVNSLTLSTKKPNFLQVPPRLGSFSYPYMEKSASWNYKKDRLIITERLDNSTDKITIEDGPSTSHQLGLEWYALNIHFYLTKLAASSKHRDAQFSVERKIERDDVRQKGPNLFLKSNIEKGELLYIFQHNKQHQVGWHRHPQKNYMRRVERDYSPLWTEYVCWHDLAKQLHMKPITKINQQIVCLVMYTCRRLKQQYCCLAWATNTDWMPNF